MIPGRTLLTNSIFVFEDDIEVLGEMAKPGVILRPQARHSRQRFCGIKATGMNRNGNE